MDIPKRDIIIVIFLLGVVAVLRQINNEKEHFAGAADQGTQFNTLVDNLQNGVLPNDLKVTGVLNVKGNIFFHNYVLNNAWTGNAIASKLYDPVVRPFLTGTQEQTAVTMGGSNENGNIYWCTYNQTCPARNDTCVRSWVINK
jgi:hypothetical protein